MVAGVALIAASGVRLAVPAIRQAEAARGRALPPPLVAATTGTPSPAASPPPPPVVTDPVRLKIPAIALDAPLVGLGLTPEKAIDTPTRWGDAGWYRPGVPPGAVGPAVLVGHYDSKSGPAVFFRLNALLPGDQIQVVGGSGTTVTFVVDRLQEVAKSTFPMQEVYGPVTRPEIRLITCDGAFDEHTRHYVDNLVVYGHAISPPTASPSPAPRPATTPSGMPRPGGQPAAGRSPASPTGAWPPGSPPPAHPTR
jgi:sortase (surface protein transpeptidase)